MSRRLPRSFPPLLVLVLLAGLALSACGGSSGDEDDGWESAPIVPQLTGELGERFRADVAIADSKGFDPGVFAKVGDSNTELPGNLYGFGCRPVEYGEFPELEQVVEKFSQSVFSLTGLPGCLPVSSFTRLSAAVRFGSYSTLPLFRISTLPEVFSRPDPVCSPDETPLYCEIRLLRPRYTIVMIGTNDISLDAKSGDVEPGSRTIERLAPMVSKIREAGSVPVLSNLPPIWSPRTGEVDEYGGIKLMNQKLAELAESEKVPLINLWRAMEEDQMIDRGLSADGIHLSVYGGENSSDVLANSVDLTEEALRYGANRRNLIWLQTLAALDRAATDTQK